MTVTLDGDEYTRLVEDNKKLREGAVIVINKNSGGVYIDKPLVETKDEAIKRLSDEIEYWKANKDYAEVYALIMLYKFYNRMLRHVSWGRVKTEDITLELFNTKGKI